MQSKDIELEGITTTSPLHVPEDSNIVVQYFSTVERQRAAKGGKLPPGTVHKPETLEAEDALEIGVLSIAGRAPNARKRALFAAAFALVAAVCGLAAYAYPRDPDFKLDATGKWLGFVGVLAVLVGAEALVFTWMPALLIAATCVPAPLRAAPMVLVTCEDGTQHPVAIAERGALGGGTVRSFTFRHLRFVARPGGFHPEPPPHPLRAAHSLFDGLPPETHAERLAWHGVNLIDVPMPSIPRQLADEILNPFMWFQVFSCIQWLLQTYWHYALIVALITTLAAVVSLVISRQNFRRLRELSRHVHPVTVVRGGARSSVPSTELVPGDLVAVEEGMDLPCDLVLVSGECLVSEAMLTGESVPVAKVPFTDATSAVPGRSKLAGGTQVLQTRSLGGAPVMAVAWATGFSSDKGRLIRSILFPRAGRMDLERDGNRFVGLVLVPMAVAGGVASCVHALANGGIFTVASALDLVSIAVPPALPACMVIGVAYAVNRLRSMSIFCIAPKRVNMAGKVDTCCFDKTGTLTFEGLNMMAILPVGPAAPAAPGAQPAPAAFQPDVGADAVAAACAVAEVASERSSLALAMAACQSVRQLATASGEELVGDPLEVVILQAAKWTLKADAACVRVSAPAGAVAAEILHTFDFNSELARMCTLVDVACSGGGGGLRALVKGSPEAVAALCDPRTVPGDFDAVLARLAGKGYRVIGAADRALAEGTRREECAAMGREQAEARGQLRFLGLIVLENKLKPCSAGVIEQLQAANITCIMVTGDHARTAVTVARAAAIVPRVGTVILCDSGGAPLGLAFTRLEGPESPEAALSSAEALAAAPSCRYVVTGAGFDALLQCAEAGDPGPLNTVLSRVAVAARYQPLQKQRIIDLLIERGHVTAFVGDGANDTAALKAADVGLSLTANAEASVAAPFTAKNAALESIIVLLLEGRAALATGFQLFKFMALYAAVQFSNSLQMNLVDTYLSEYEFLYVDTLLVLPLSMVLPHTRAWRSLDPRRPADSLLHWQVVASVAGQAAICLALQLAARAAVRSQCWFIPSGFQCCSYYSPASPPPPPANASLAPGLPAGLVPGPLPGGGLPLQSSCPQRLVFNSNACIACEDAFSSIVPGYENTALWLLTNFQYLWLAAALAVAKPFRQPQWTNLPFSALWVTLTAFSWALVFTRSPAVLGLLQLIDFPDYNFRWCIATLALLSGLATFAWEAALDEAEEWRTAEEIRTLPQLVKKLRAKARAREAAQGAAYAQLE